MMRQLAIRHVVLAAVSLLFMIACLSPAIDFGQRGGPEGLRGVVRGWTALVLGWVAAIIIAPIPQLGWSQKLVFASWLANPLVVFGGILLAYKRHRGAAAAGLLAVILGAWYLAFPFGRPLIGAYIWVASSGVLAGGALAARLVRERPTTEPGEPDAAPGTLGEPNS